MKSKSVNLDSRKETNLEQSAFESSIIGYICFGHGKPEIDENLEKQEKESEEDETRGRQTQIFDEQKALKNETHGSLLSWMATPDFIVAGFYFIIMDIRCVSYPGWALSWFQWTFSDNPNYGEYVSLLGMHNTYFFLIIIK